MTEPARKPGAVDAGVFVAAFVLMLVSIAQGWMVLAAVAAVVTLGVMVTTAARRQLGGSERPRDSRRPWQRGDH
ncbi:hypothetical protein [Streptomyces sp. NBC_01373]|uniref:hypothetical protein n=1 Tax=Streptomyces sp. NBC_01373 TaxID=2903843 RepID=UPI00225072FD|nr:hypothetical protein [Streptomyces sp. NBC_01373]MCX4707084.1 hypothetical protein [Streptomyces sp. NBC_01373]